MVQGIDAVKARNARKAPVTPPSFTVVVDPNGNGDVRTIAEALTILASTGGRIELSEGTHAITATLAIPLGRRIEIAGQTGSTVLQNVGGLRHASVIDVQASPFCQLPANGYLSIRDVSINDTPGGIAFLFSASNTYNLFLQNIYAVGFSRLLDNTATPLGEPYIRAEGMFVLGAVGAQFLFFQTSTAINATVLDFENVFASSGDQDVGGFPRCYWTNVQSESSNATGFRIGEASRLIDVRLTVSGSSTVDLGESTGTMSGILTVGCNFNCRHRTNNSVFIGHKGQIVDDVGLALTGNRFFGCIDGTYRIGAAAFISKEENNQTVSADQDFTAVNPIPYRTLMVDASGAGRTVTLPVASSHRHFVLTIKKFDSSANTVTIQVAGGGTIDGAASIVLRVQYDAVTVQSNGTQWFVVAEVESGGGSKLYTNSGSTTDAYVSEYIHTGSKGLLGNCTVKNTHATNSLTIRRTVTDAFGTVGATREDVVAPSSDYTFDWSENVGAGRPPYVSVQVELKSTAAGNAATYQIAAHTQG